MEFLKGKKTHIIAVLMMLVGVIQMLTGEATGLPMIMEHGMTVLEGFGLSTLRAGVAKIA